MNYKSVAQQIHQLRLNAHNLRQLAFADEQQAAKLERLYMDTQRREFEIKQISDKLNINGLSDDMVEALITKLKARLNR